MLFGIYIYVYVIKLENYISRLSKRDLLKLNVKKKPGYTARAKGMSQAWVFMYLGVDRLWAQAKYQIVRTVAKAGRAE